jgi:hypothetical protein
MLTVRFIEEAEDFPSGPQIRAVIENAAERKDLRTLRRRVEAYAALLASSEDRGVGELEAIRQLLAST